MKWAEACPHCGRKISLWNIRPSKKFRCQCSVDYKFDWGLKQTFLAIFGSFLMALPMVLIGEWAITSNVIDGRWASLLIRTLIGLFILFVYHLKQAIALNTCTLHEVGAEETARRLDVDRALRRHLRRLTADSIKGRAQTRLSALRFRYWAINAGILSIVAGGWTFIFGVNPPLGYRSHASLIFAWLSLVLCAPAAAAGKGWMARTLSVDGINELIVNDVPVLGPKDGTPEDFCLRLVVLAYMRRAMCWLMHIPATLFCIGPLMLAGLHAPLVYWIDFLAVCASVGFIYGESPTTESIVEIFDERLLSAIQELKVEP